MSNNHELKFRAWTANSWINEGMVYDWQDKVYIESETFTPDDIPIMQYIGIHDKNGKEVYESDIVHFKADGLSGFGIVYYNNEMARFEIKDIRPQTSRRGQRYYPFYDDAVYRVDGNIYENPELIQS